MNSLKESLRKAIDRNLALQESQKGANKNDEDEDILFEKEFRKVNLGLKDSEDKKCNEQSHETNTKHSPCTLSIVPPFYVGLPPENDDLRQKLREEARGVDATCDGVARLRECQAVCAFESIVV